VNAVAVVLTALGLGLSAGAFGLRPGLFIGGLALAGLTMFVLDVEG